MSTLPARRRWPRLLVLGLTAVAGIGCRRATPAPAPADTGRASVRPAPARARAPAPADTGRAPIRPLPRRRVAPALPALPKGLVPLPVPRYRPAVFVAPTRRDAPPWPVVLILHGNFDRPEWECAWWRAAAAPHGWLLSPRGIPRTDVPRSYDRWTYAGATPAIREAQAALDVLKARYPGLLREDGALYVGFSLGAILGGRAMVASRLRFTHAALVEGGDAIDFSHMRQLAKRGLRRVAYLCGQHSGCGRRAKGALRRWRRAGVQARLWVMPGAGHGYNDDFDPLGKQVVAWLLAPPAAPAVAPQPGPAPPPRRRSAGLLP